MLRIHNNNEFIALGICELNTSRKWPKWIRMIIIYFKFKKFMRIVNKSGDPDFFHQPMWRVYSDYLNSDGKEL